MNTSEKEKNLAEEIRLVMGDPQGQCYAASEAFYHMMGGKFAGFIPHYMSLPSHCEHSSHWFLKNREGIIIDLTKDQYNFELEYCSARGCGFLTKQPSKKAQLIIDKVVQMRHPKKG